MDQSAVLVRSNDVTSENAAGEAIIIHMQSGTYFSLDEVGTIFWDRLDGTLTIAEHADAIAKVYAAEVAEIASDLVELAEGLVSEGLAREVGAAS